jgi:hypothetical protein
MVSNVSSWHFRDGCELSAAFFPRLLARPFVRAGLFHPGNMIACNLLGKVKSSGQ